MNPQSLIDNEQRYNQTAPYYSVIMPCFNSDQFIKDSIKSVLNQTDTDFELIVVDDGSNDRSQEIILSFSNLDSRVKYFKNSGSRGASGARNYGASVAKGKWLCFLDSDDVFLRHCLEHRRTCIEGTDFDFFSSDFYRWFEDEEMVRQSKANWHWELYFKGSDNIDVIPILNAADVFLEGVIAWTGGVTIRNSVFQSLSGFNEALKRAEDHHLWLRCAAFTGKVGLISQPDVFYRIRNDGLSGGINRQTSYSVTMYEMLLKDPLFSNFERLINKNLDRALYLVCLSGRNNGDWRRAVDFGFRYWLRSPFNKKRFRNLIGAFFLKK
ncbi:glycosyltransferase family 2 protein [Marinobacter xiaoshiensis]|uniref:Glycosyltransferase family 2 protein n=1 Tax=Marinobacter xiaoshiensis TaxID=3073652 RepID=A0ABU2HHA4_9GAMM|nr:glycosyltransferase family 2 protein [Marinobacter sp. F60267]MDS1309931.1 glycosyltransferase family 2 protein [Marinobacter sp. F60267]